MSRLDQRLRRDLRQIADRATPSPDAWQTIQTRIADQAPNQETEIIMLVENTTTPVRRRALVVAAAAAVLALVVGVIALIARRDDAEIPADERRTPTPAPEVVREPPAAGEAIAPGRYATDAFGVTVTFEVPAGTTAPWTVQVNDDVALTIGDADGFVNMSRVGSFYDAEEALAPWPESPSASAEPGLGSFGPLDIDDWIEANSVVVEAQADTTVGGRTAHYRQVFAPAGATGGCVAALQPCLAATSASADLQDVYSGPSTVVYGEHAFAFWVIELADFEPLVIWAGLPMPAERADVTSWLDEIAPMIDSIELGDPAPVVEDGTARVSTFGRELPVPGGTLAAGRYASDALGVPIAFDVGVAQTAPWTLLNEEPGRLWLISTGSDQEFIALGRLGSWYDAAEARDASTTGLGSIPPGDVDRWIEENGIIVLESADVDVGGRTAQYRRVRLDTTPGATADFCGATAPCLWAASGSADVVGGAANPLEIGIDRAQSIWVVDVGEFEPIYIFAASRFGDAGDEQWLSDVVRPFVDSIALGEPAPAVPGGTARVAERTS